MFAGGWGHLAKICFFVVFFAYKRRPPGRGGRLQLLLDAGGAQARHLASVRSASLNTSQPVEEGSAERWEELCSQRTLRSP